MRSSFEHMPDEALIRAFVQLGIEQDKAELQGEVSKLKRLTFQVWDLEKELKSRAGDKRKLLSVLYSHKNAWVRINAIQATLAVNPKEALRQLEILAETHEYPPSAEARGTLRKLKNGTYIPE